MISAITMMSDIIITVKYPYRHCSSGMYTKFIPYQPVINVSGRKIVVTMVITAIILFVTFTILCILITMIIMQRRKSIK